MNRHFISAQRYFLLLFVIVGVFGVVLWRLFDLQLNRRDEYRSIAAESRQRLRVIDAERGKIFDRNGMLLAGTRSLMVVGVDPHSLTDVDFERVSELAELTGVAESEIREAFDSKWFPASREVPARPRRWVKLHDGVTERRYKEIRELGVRAVYGNRHYVRIYPGGKLAAHVLGFRNQAGYGLGVEHCMDYYLSGEAGWMETERDGRRRELAQFRTREVTPFPGFDVELTLDVVVQHYVEQEIERLVDEYQPKGISIIVTNAVNGDLLALANHPAFDPNAYGNASAESYRNRAMTDVYEPGSTFKIVPVAAALERNLVTVETEFDCNKATYSVGGKRLPFPGDDHPIGVASVATILYKSSNRGAAQLGLRLGPDRLHKAALQFGFGAPSGLPLTAEFMPLDGWDGVTGEIGGILHDPSQWDGLTISRLPMGHAVGATPLQVHMAMGVVASGGWLLQPRVVRRVVDRDGETVLEFPSLEKERVLSFETAASVARILEKVAKPGGTARRAEIPGFGVAGKTGTARKLINGQYSNRHHVASFSGFLPSWEPQIVVTVVVNEPRMDGTVGYGGLVAAPAFRNVAEACIQYLGIAGSESLVALNEEGSL